jgi:hypothetical protein
MRSGFYFLFSDGRDFIRIEIRDEWLFPLNRYEPTDKRRETFIFQLPFSILPGIQTQLTDTIFSTFLNSGSPVTIVALRSNAEARVKQSANEILYCALSSAAW